MSTFVLGLMIKLNEADDSCSHAVTFTWDGIDEIDTFCKHSTKTQLSLFGDMFSKKSTKTNGIS